MLIATVVILLLVIVAVVYVFLVMPRVVDAADMDLQSTDYAHRGLHSAKAPENSLAAFKLAKEQGYGIELDVRMSADGKIFVFHDEYLKRMCGIDKRLSQLSAAQIRQLRLLGTNERIPLLTEVLTLVDGNVPLLIEIKQADNVKALSKRLCEIMDTYVGAFAIQAFDPRVLGYFKKYRPRFARGQLVTKLSKQDAKNTTALKSPFLRFAFSHMLTNVISRPDFISIDGRLINEPAFLLATLVFRSRGFVWTVRSQKQYATCRQRGLYCIFENINP